MRIAHCFGWLVENDSAAPIRVGLVGGVCQLAESVEVSIGIVLMSLLSIDRRMKPVSKT